MDNLYINDKHYFLEFDVRPIDTGDNQFRILRLEQK